MPMFGAVLIVLGLAATPQAASPRPEDLIARLGSPRYADREAAAAELERLGRLSLPALMAWREHRDLEVRSRVKALVAKIEGALLLEPTPVALDFDDRPLGEVVSSIARRSDLPVALGPNTPIARRITLRAERPVPFWTAIDRLADVADLGYALPTLSAPNARDRPLLLAPSTPRPPGLMSDHGPFRVNLMSLHYQRDLSFVGNAAGMPNRMPGMMMGIVPPVPPNMTTSPDGRLINEQFYVRLQAAAEPRLALRQVGVLKVASAVDDLGQSLVALPTPDAPNTGGRMVVNYGMTTTGPLNFQVTLRRPESPGRIIRLLRGSIPASVSTRRPNPLSIPLDGAAGKSFRNEDAAVVIHDARPAAPNAGANGPVNIELSVIPEASRAATAPPEPAPELDPFLQRTDIGPLQIELIDASGRLVNWYLSTSQQNGDETRLTLTSTPGPGGAPVALRYFGTVRANTEIPFEFRDVPMP